MQKRKAGYQYQSSARRRRAAAAPMSVVADTGALVGGSTIVRVGNNDTRGPATALVLEQKLEPKQLFIAKVGQDLPWNCKIQPFGIIVLLPVNC